MNSGTLDVDEITKALQELGFAVSMDDIVGLLEELRPGSRVLHFVDFLELVHFRKTSSCECGALKAGVV